MLNNVTFHVNGPFKAGRPLREAKARHVVSNFSMSSSFGKACVDLYYQVPSCI